MELWPTSRPPADEDEYRDQDGANPQASQDEKLKNCTRNSHDSGLMLDRSFFTLSRILPDKKNHRAELLDQMLSLKGQLAQRPAGQATTAWTPYMRSV